MNYSGGCFFPEAFGRKSIFPWSWVFILLFKCQSENMKQTGIFYLPIVIRDCVSSEVTWSSLLPREVSTGVWGALRCRKGAGLRFKWPVAEASVGRDSHVAKGTAASGQNDCMGSYWTSWGGERAALNFYIQGLPPGLVNCRGHYCVLRELTESRLFKAQFTTDDPGCSSQSISSWCVLFFPLTGCCRYLFEELEREK